MAITTTTISIESGWVRSDVINQLESAFTWLGWHGDTKTGIVTGIISYSGGGTVGTSSTDYYDVFPISTSGIGTGASFRIDRSNGAVDRVYVNRPGSGYINGEILQISAEDIGGSSKGATNITLSVNVAGGGSPIGYGSTTTFYDKDSIPDAEFPWGVLRHTIEPNKKFGDTYRIFQVTSDTNLNVDVGSGFHPWNNNNFSDKGNGVSNRLCGDYLLDTSTTPVTSISYNIYNSSNINYSQVYQERFSSSRTYKLDLNIYRSGIDPNFAVLSFRHPTLASTKLRDNTYFTFIPHNFTTNIWDLDYLFLGGITQIIPSTSEANANLEFKTYCQGNSYLTANGGSKRNAEFGYLSWGGSSTSAFKSTYYQSTSNADVYNSSYSGIYVRTDNITNQQPYFSRSRGGDNSSTAVSSNSNFNSVIKGIPINGTLIPVPYYIPDDFVLIDFDYEAPSANIQQGDTVTISGSEVYTVIQGSYNQDSRTRGILFCARKV